MTECERVGGYNLLEETEEKPLPAETGSPNLSYREPLQVKKSSLAERVLRWRKYIILILTPVLLIPIPITVKGTVRERCDLKLYRRATLIKFVL